MKVSSLIGLVVGSFLHLGTAADERVEALHDRRRADRDAQQDHVGKPLHGERDCMEGGRNHV